MINVTKTYLPDFEKYTQLLKRAWDKTWITNNGELVQELEQKLKDYLEVRHLFYCSNGTVVLQMALKALKITQEVITTPYSYVATANSILWEGATPVFVDIDKTTCCIDTTKIEKSINEKTQAILATHVYGFPCDVEAIEQLASKYKLKVIYDGAHAFGSKLNNRSLLSYGNISTCSFHATKLFHTVEGGCVITDDDEIANQLMLYRQFGHVYDDYYSVGINAKNSEFHAAMGLCIYDDFEKLLAKRKLVLGWYRNRLTHNDLILPFLKNENFKWNYSYCPVIFKSEDVLLNIVQILKNAGIVPRRYFYPSLNKISFINGAACPVSEDISLRVLCLPSFHDITEDEVDLISKLIIDEIC
jgi:dTDP-4-amino-4,6-dideoxygalactose transaminase